jgi:hypothetical protein
MASASPSITSRARISSVRAPVSNDTMMYARIHSGPCSAASRSASAWLGEKSCLGETRSQLSLLCCRWPATAAVDVALRLLHEAEASRAGRPGGHHTRHMACDHNAFPGDSPGRGAGQPVCDAADALEPPDCWGSRCPHRKPVGASGDASPADAAVVSAIDGHQQPAVDRADRARALGGRQLHEATVNGQADKGAPER